MYQRIMVAIDRDPGAVQILDEAARIAGCSGGHLCIVHVDTEGDPCRAATVLEDATRAVASGVVVDKRLLEADPYHGVPGIALAIAAQVDAWQADLLVIGSANRHGLERFVIGSVAAQLLSEADTSLLLVRPHKIPNHNKEEP